MQDINILNRAGAGILVENLSGNMSVVGNTTMTNGASAVTDHGIDVNNTSGNISFGGSLGITGSNGEGISFNSGGNTGVFSVTAQQLSPGLPMKRSSSWTTAPSFDLVTLFCLITVRRIQYC